MFTPLPATTVFEAKARNRRDTILLFAVLVVLYVLFFNLIALTLFGDLGRLLLSLQGRGFSFGQMTGWVSAVAVAVAFVHFLIARSKTLEDVLEILGARPADPHDRYHQVFMNLVAEAESAIGIRPIRPVVLPTPGSNAFAVADGRGRAALGVTEGLLTRLERNELSAVVAHEASHLLHGDSRLMTTACSLFGILGSIRSGLGRGASGSRRGAARSHRGGSGRMVLAWLVASAGYFLTKMVCMALSRRREFLADEHAVHLCKDPLALAQALSKVAGKYRGGGGDVNEGYAPLFIMNPAESRLDEGTGFLSDLFSTHPPLPERLSRLMGFARMNARMFQERMEMKRREEAAFSSSAAPVQAEPLFYANREGEWFGPSTPQQLLAAGLLGPQVWISPSGSQDVMRASETPALIPLLQGLGPKADSKHSCPRCRMALVEKAYEGLDLLHCPFCKGHLLKAGHLERIIARREERFDPNDVKNARQWRDRQKGPLKDCCGFTAVRCPYCDSSMSKMFHSLVTRVVIDRCTSPSCRAVWCDGGELETLQMLVEGDSKAAGFDA